MKIVGTDVVIDADAVFKNSQSVVVGSHVAIDKGFYCTTSINIGDYVHIGPYVTCVGGKDAHCQISGYNNIMAGSRLICASDRFDDSGLFGAMIPKAFKGKQINKPIILEPLSNIGTNAIVLPGSHLRIGVLLCAGSLLMGDTVEWGVYKGNPAKLVKIVDSKKALKYFNELKN